MEPLHVIALGAGVQSSTMALMAAKGLITPMPDAAIFADTQDEPAAVYHWLNWLKEQLPFPVIIVTKGRLSTKATTVRTSKKTGQTYLKPQLPVFTKYQTMRRGGMMARHCSADMKIDPLRSKAKQLAGKGRPIVTWLGISTDEPERIKDSPDPRITNRWPLIDLNMSRSQCLTWMKEQNYPTPPRSACIFCPYHSDAEWLRIKAESEQEFQFAVQFEKDLQHAFAQCPRLDSIPYLHSSRIPLDQVQFKDNDQNGFRHQQPCLGICGV